MKYKWDKDDGVTVLVGKDMKFYMGTVNLTEEEYSWVEAIEKAYWATQGWLEKKIKRKRKK